MQTIVRLRGNAPEKLAPGLGRFHDRGPDAF
jgi:hypothetical protein